MYSKASWIVVFLPSTVGFNDNMVLPSALVAAKKILWFRQ